MKIISNFILCLKKMENFSKRIIYLSTLLVVITYISATIVLTAFDFNGDLTTALYWAEQLALLGKELLGATFVPVFIFEIIFYAKGMKRAIN